MFACKCLNVVIECESSDKVVDKNSLQLTQDETQDLFFNQELHQVEVLLKLTKVLPKLLLSKEIGNWTVWQCLNCQLYTHAVHKKSTGQLLIPANLISASDIGKLKKSEQFSRVFNIVISSNTNSKDPTGENFELKRQMDDSIKQATLLTEERIRLYTEQQEHALEVYKEKAQREYKALARNLAKHTLDLKKMEMEQMKSTKPLIRKDSVAHDDAVPDVQSEDAIPQTNLVTSISQKQRARTFLKNNDAECLFAIEDMENHDVYASESENSGSDNEDSASTTKNYQQRGSARQQYILAKSLPMDIPYMPALRGGDDYDEDPNQPEETTDIAASMKALAKSVHGEMVFGDVPRPSFRTNI